MAATVTKPMKLASSLSYRVARRLLCRQKTKPPTAAAAVA